MAASDFFELSLVQRWMHYIHEACGVDKTRKISDWEMKEKKRLAVERARIHGGGHIRASAISAC